MVLFEVKFLSRNTPGSYFEGFQNIWIAVTLLIFGRGAMSKLYSYAKYFIKYEYPFLSEF